jgi:hypothetical protein
MSDGGQLLFGNEAWFPMLWMLGLLGFVALWWYASGAAAGLRRLFLILWGPAALVAGCVYGSEGYGQPVTETLGLLTRADSAMLRSILQMPLDGPTLTFAFVVGGAVAVVATLALHVIGILLGAVLSLAPSRR